MADLPPAVSDVGFLGLSRRGAGRSGLPVL